MEVGDIKWVGSVWQALDLSTDQCRSHYSWFKCKQDSNFHLPFPSTSKCAGVKQDQCIILCFSDLCEVLRPTELLG